MSRWICTLLGILFLFGQIAAGEKANTLTKKEATDGWLLLFDGETTFGWDVKGDAAVKDGALIVGGKKDTSLTFRTPFAFYQLEYEAQQIRAADANKPARLVIQHQRKGDSPKRVYTYIAPKSGRYSIKIEKRLGYADLHINVQWIVNGKEISRRPTPPAKIPGYKLSSIRIEVPAGGKVALRNIKLKPLSAVSLFNGKNLDGWKVLPGYKSKYTVTKEGWLNVKDGRGDIQTTTSFKNFVLQLDCISNGKHLNSGIFFRCIPNQYQQGYEAQIRNQFTPGEKRAYKLNKFDPKTHKSLGTYVVESTAFDYGTGAIYRRMPARKGVAKDGEWFTMTVAAHDNHFATWVNGVQVVDWTDHRPLNDNARKSCCLNPGVISIQGHDPTTDLSFRNFRIFEDPSN